MYICIVKYKEQIPMRYTSLRRNQKLLFFDTNSIPKDPIALIIDAFVDKMAKSIKILPEPRNTGKGRPRYVFLDMLKMIIYGYSQNIRSSRKLEHSCRSDINFMYLMDGAIPDDKTIYNYKVEYSGIIKELLDLLRVFLTNEKYIDGKEVYIDGTKIKANANHYTILDMNNFPETEEEITKIAKGDEELAEELVTKLKKRKKVKVARNDPQAEDMRTRQGMLFSYNVQEVTDSKNNLIVCTEVTSEENDKHQLEPMSEKAEEALGKKPGVIVADAGYYTPDAIQRVEEKGINTCIAVQGSKDTKKRKCFTYNKKTKEVTCLNGKKLRLKAKGRQIPNTIADEYECRECMGCPFKGECWTKRTKGKRYYFVYHNQDFRDEYVKRMEKSKSQRLMKERKKIEHVHANIKRIIGVIYEKGRKRVQTVVDLATIAYNLKRLLKIEGPGQLYTIIKNYQIEA